MSDQKPLLYSYFRSSCAWRVRIALNYKGIEYETKPVHLLKNEQVEPDYLKINPMGQVPALVINGQSLVQSLAILEYLEEVYPEKRPLLPKDPVLRAKVRGICELIASGIQPLQNLKVQHQHSPDNPDERFKWAGHWIETGFEALEKTLEETSGEFCVGNEISLADCCLIPQVYNAERFKVDVSRFERINRIHDTLSKIPAFQKAHPNQQPDFVV